MAQSVVIQVGQSGNQIGRRFWDLVLHEHAEYNTSGIYDESLATFFKNADSRDRILRVKDAKGKIHGLKARAVCVDMEEGVLSSLKRSHLSELFSPHQFISSTDGSGNNWAMGNCHYGPQYRDKIYDSIRKEVEMCDALSSFFIIHSLGGGTGSGLGTYILELCQEEFPECVRFANVVFPSRDDDVVTSPYNAILSLDKLIKHADAILPFSNDALIDIVNTIEKARHKPGTGITEDPVLAMSDNEKKTKTWEATNSIIANLLMNLTAGMRFPGPFNVDLNEIATTLVPFDNLKFLTSAMTPLYGQADLKFQGRNLDQHFMDTLANKNHLLHFNSGILERAGGVGGMIGTPKPDRNVCMAMAFLCRGQMTVEDIRRNISKIVSFSRTSPNLSFPSWNPSPFKTALCSHAPLQSPISILKLSNETKIRHSLKDIHGRWQKLYKRKAFLWNYEKYLERDVWGDVEERVQSVIREYGQIETDEAVQK